MLSCPPVSVDLEEVVEHGHELPLPIHLLAASETESSKPDRRADVGEHRLHHPQPVAIDMTALEAVDFSFHPLERTLGLLFGLAKLDVHSELDDDDL